MPVLAETARRPVRHQRARATPGGTVLSPSPLSSGLLGGQSAELWTSGEGGAYAQPDRRRNRGTAGRDHQRRFQSFTGSTRGSRGFGRKEAARPLQRRRQQVLRHGHGANSP